jgi:hypothetical protein
MVTGPRTRWERTHASPFGYSFRSCVPTAWEDGRKHAFGSSASVLVPVFSRKWLVLESLLYKHLSELRQVSSQNNITRLRHDLDTTSTQLPQEGQPDRPRLTSLRRARVRVHCERSGCCLHSSMAIASLQLSRLSNFLFLPHLRAKLSLHSLPNGELRGGGGRP